MAVLILGLVLFLGLHSVRIVADGWRSDVIARRGEGPWKGLYSIGSVVGLVLVVWGYSLARQQPVVLYTPPTGLRHLALLLMFVAFVLLAAYGGPRNHVRAKLHHPMVLGVKVWALAHLLANGSLADVLLFGSFLVWSVLLFRASRRRDRAAGTVYPPGTAAGTALSVAVGAGLWALFVFWAHGFLFGVQPLG